jgi:hypothetical protein
MIWRVRPDAARALRSCDAGDRDAAEFATDFSARARVFARAANPHRDP